MLVERNQRCHGLAVNLTLVERKEACHELRQEYGKMPINESDHCHGFPRDMMALFCHIFPSVTSDFRWQGQLRRQSSRAV